MLIRNLEAGDELTATADLYEYLDEQFPQNTTFSARAGDRLRVGSISADGREAIVFNLTTNAEAGFDLDGDQLEDFTNHSNRVRCDSCDVMVINGTICHERGCPDAWQDETRECRWCGTAFKPEDGDQYFCDDDCSEAFNG